MSKCFISFGYVNKKFIILFLVAFFSLSLTFCMSNFLKNEINTNIIFQMASNSIGGMLAKIIPKLRLFFNKSKKLIENDKNKKFLKCKQTIKHYFLLSIFFIIYISLFLINAECKIKIGKEESIKNYFTTDLYSTESIEVLLITIISIFLLKYKYFRHHIISLVLFIILSFSIDFFFGNFLYKSNSRYIILYFITYFFEIFTDSLSLTYQKYMIDKFYFSPYNIILFLSVLLLIVSFILVLLSFIFKDQNIGIELLTYLDISKYFHSNDNSSIIIFLLFIAYIILRFLYYLFYIYTIYYFTPNHILISLELSKCLDLIINNDNLIGYFVLIPFFFQFICLTVFLEILELNFCSLNKYTKYNILKREKEEMLYQEEKNNSRYDSMVEEIEEIAPGYIIRKNEFNDYDENIDIKKAKKTELNYIM